jgi:glucose/arabinose dehydrogenase
MRTLNSSTLIVAVALSTATTVKSQNILTTVAGTDPVFTGEGKRAEGVTLGTIRGVAIDRNGGVLFSDADFGLVLKLGLNNTLHVVAGTGVQDYSGDGGPARSARLGRAAGLAVHPDGSIYLADNERVWRSSPGGSFPADVVRGEEDFARRDRRYDRRRRLKRG